jgi:outer membrane protein assembly factor BamB
MTRPLALGLVLTLSSLTFAAEDVRMLTVGGEGAGYWPGWRGPSAQGYVAGSGYPDTWSDTENVLWKVGVPGRGNSSPIVWDDRLFLTTAYDGGRKLSILCYRRADGTLRWETPVPHEGVERGHAKNGHASATPVTDGKRVYASFGSQGLVAVDFAGKIVWQRPLPPLDNYHGSAGSPVLYGNTVILYQDHKGQSFVAAFDRETGKTRWWTDRKTRIGWGTPITLRAGGRDELIVSSEDAVSAYDPRNGRPLWTAQGNTFEVIPTPTVGHGLVFCSSGRAGPTLAIRPGGKGDVTDTHVVWETVKGSSFVPPTIIVGEQLYMVNDMSSVVTSYEAKTGELVFQGRLGSPRREGFSASPVAVDGKVFFTNDDGETFVLKAGPQLEILHVNRLNARTLASPALVDGRWYFRTDRQLLCIGNGESVAATD